LGKQKNTKNKHNMTTLREANQHDAAQIGRIMKQMFNMEQHSAAKKAAHLKKAFHCLGLKIPGHWYTNKEGVWCCIKCGMYASECMCCVHGKPSRNWNFPECHPCGCSSCGHVSILEEFGYSPHWVCGGCNHSNVEYVSACEKCDKENPGYIAALTIADAQTPTVVQPSSAIH